MKLEDLLDSRYRKLRAIGSTATELQKGPPDKLKQVRQAAEKFVKAGKIKQIAPEKVKV